MIEMVKLLKLLLLIYSSKRFRNAFKYQLQKNWNTNTMRSVNGDWITWDIISKIGMANWISMFSSVSKLLSEMEISLASFSSESRPATLESESLSTTTVVLRLHFWWRIIMAWEGQYAFFAYALLKFSIKWRAINMKWYDCIINRNLWFSFR